MNAEQKWRFRWFAGGKHRQAIVEAENYPLACYKLGVIHFTAFAALGRAPRDFAIDLTKEEPVVSPARAGLIVLGKCRVCGCTDTDCRGCIAKTGQPCAWVDDDHTLCSACV